MYGETDKGRVYGSDNDGRGMAEGNREDSEKYVSAVFGDRAEDGDKDNASVRSSGLQAQRFIEGDRGQVDEQGSGEDKGERPRNMDNDHAKQEQWSTDDITRVDVEWCLYILNRWYISNTELVENIEKTIPSLSFSNNVYSMDMIGLPNIREIQQRALANLRQKAGEPLVIDLNRKPSRMPLFPPLVKLVEKLGFNNRGEIDIDLLTPRNITFLVTLLNKWVTVQMVVAQTLRQVKTKSHMLPKYKPESREEKKIVKIEDKELEEELGEVEKEL